MIDEFDPERLASQSQSWVCLHLGPYAGRAINVTWPAALDHGWQRSVLITAPQ